MFTKLKKVCLLIGCLLLIASTAVAAPFWPLQVGTQSKLSGTDSLGNSWVSTFDIVGTATYNSKEYFHVQQYNYENGGEPEDIYIRVTDTQCFMYKSDLGAEVLTVQIGAVGTQWNWPKGGGDYMYYEITSIGPVSVPYGTFATTYGITHCQGHSGAGGNISNCTTPTCIDYFAPGIGYVKEIDNWNTNNPPDTEVLSSFSNHSVYADWAASGLWEWSGSAWSQIHTIAPITMVTAGSTLYATWASGLYAWDGTAWSQIHPLVPTNMVTVGSTLYATWASGLYAWDGTAWSQIHPLVPTNMVASGSALYAIWDGSGLWKWDGTAWSQIHPIAPTNMVAGF